MQQPTLSFDRITTDAWRRQVEQTAAAVNAAAAALPPPPTKRHVGRPKRALQANHILTAAAAAFESEEQPSKMQRTRGKYTDWFSSPYIHDILREYRRCGYRASVAIERLQSGAPDDRYARLSHSSLIGWFDKEHKLLPRYQSYLDSGLENARQNGFASALEEVPGIEEEIKDTLQQMRAAGTAINSRVIRWVMRGIIQHRAPVDAKAHSLTLGQSFISAWARRNLKWSWRKATTSASKLPLDWEEQGLHMAMRIAATMEMKKVSLSQASDSRCSAWLIAKLKLNAL